MRAIFAREDGSGIVRTVCVPPNARGNIWAADYPELVGRRFATFLESVTFACGNAVVHPFVAERASYVGDAFDAGRRPEHRFVAVHDGAVVGWIACSDVSSRPVYAGVVEHSVYVHPDAQGRGVGSLLLEHFVASTEAAGVWTIQSSLFTENVASRRSVAFTFLSALATGLGFLLAFIALGAFREIVGHGTLLSGIELLAGGRYGSLTLELPVHGVLVAILPPGAFFGLGLLLALRNRLRR